MTREYQLKTVTILAITFLLVFGNFAILISPVLPTVIGDPPFSSNIMVNSDSSSSRQENPTMAVDSSGRIFVAWQDDRNGHLDIYFANSLDSGLTWTSEKRINSDSGSSDQYLPSLTTDSLGNLFLVWEDFRNGDWDIYYAKSNDLGATWTDPNVRVNTDSGDDTQFDPTITVDSAGNIYAAWEDFRNGNWDIYFACSTDGGATWSDPNIKINSDDGTDSQTNPSIAVDSSGAIYVTWQDNRNGDLDIFFAKSLDGGGTWTNPNKKINTDNSNEIQRNPSLFVDSSGFIYLAWQDYRNSNADIYFAKSTDGGETWTNPNIKVNTDNGTHGQFNPSIVVDHAQNIFLTWQDNRNVDLDIYFASSTDGGSNWTDPNLRVNDDLTSETQRFPILALDSSGFIYVAWQDRRNGDYDIYSSSMFPLTPLPSADSLSVDYNTSDSLPSGSEITITYNTAPYPTDGPPLEDGTTYRLRVSVANSSGVWSAAYDVEFHMNEVLAPVIPISPQDDSLIEASTDQTVTWTSPGKDSEGDSPVSYAWEVATDSNFVNIVESGSGTDTTSGQFDTTQSTNFYWRVNLTDSWETSSYGNPPDGYWNFTTYNPPENNPPTITNKLEVPAKAYVGIPLTFTFTAADNDSDPMTWSKISGENWLNIGLDNGTIYGTPASETIGANNFQIQVSDGKGGIDSHPFIIEVEATPTSNELPVITNIVSIPTTVTANSSLSFTFSATDTDLDSLYWNKVSGPEWLKIGQTNGTIYGIPTSDDIGPNEFTFRVSDGKGGTDNHTFTITVQSGSDGDGGDGNGGDGDGHEKSSSESSNLWLLIIIIIVILAVISSLLLIRKKKPKEPINPKKPHEEELPPPTNTY
jgi:hypothetical protein